MPYWWIITCEKKKKNNQKWVEIWGAWDPSYYSRWGLHHVSIESTRLNYLWSRYTVDEKTMHQLIWIKKKPLKNPIIYRVFQHHPRSLTGFLPSTALFLLFSRKIPKDVSNFHALGQCWMIWMPLSNVWCEEWKNQRLSGSNEKKSVQWKCMPSYLGNLL